MYFNFDLIFNMTLSSADNHFKQFRPRSGPNLSGPDRGPTVKYFRVYEKVKLNRCILTLR